MALKSKDKQKKIIIPVAASLKMCYSFSLYHFYGVCLKTALYKIYHKLIFKSQNLTRKCNITVPLEPIETNAIKWNLLLNSKVLNKFTQLSIRV